MVRKNSTDSRLTLRKQGFLGLAVLIAIGVLLTLLFTDRWLENQMESLGSNIVGARVEFEGVDFSFLHPGIRWDSLQVANPNDTWRNLFSTGVCELRLSLQPLLSGKIIVRQLAVTGFRLNTARGSDGKLPRPAKPKELPAPVRALATRLQAETRQMPIFNLQRLTGKVNADSLWKLVDLHSPAKIDSLKITYQHKYAEWETTLARLPGEPDLRRIREQVETLNLQQIKSLDGLEKALSTIRTVSRQVDSLKQVITSTRSALKAELLALQQTPTSVQEWINQDLTRAARLTQLPEINVRNAARALFGSQILQKIETVTHYLGTARYYAAKLQSTRPQKESPPRFRGQDIHFIQQAKLPDFWIQKVDLSGAADEKLKLAGQITDITSQQKLVGKPTALRIQGSRKDGASLQLDGVLDYRADPARESIEASARKMPLSNVRLSNFPLLPYRFSQGEGRLDVQLNFSGSDFQSQIQFIATAVEFDTSEEIPGLNPRLQSLVRQIARSISTIEFVATLRQTADKFLFRISSNLDNVVAEKAKAVASNEVRKAQLEIENRVLAEVRPRQQALLELIQKQQAEIDSRIKQAESQLQAIRGELQKRQAEIEARIEAEKQKATKKIQEEAKKKLKDIFKK